MNFIDFARIHGVEIDLSKFFASDRIRRCGTVTKPRSGNGAYFWDGQRGWVMDWSGEAKVVWYNDPDAKPWSDQEKREWSLRRAQAATDQQKRHEQAADIAERALKNAEIKEHNYLHYKGFPEEKGFVLEDRLLIPMRNVKTNRLQGYQAISWNSAERKYDKKMLAGMMAKHAVLWLGPRPASEIWFVEGYATGLSVRNALRSCGLGGAVVVCFSASNLVNIANQISNNRFVFADNDESGTGEKAAKETGLPWAMSDKVGEDANDLHKRAGLFALVAKLMECRSKVAIYC